MKNDFDWDKARIKYKDSPDTFEAVYMDSLGLVEDIGGKIKPLDMLMGVSGQPVKAWKCKE